MTVFDFPSHLLNAEIITVSSSSGGSLKFRSTLTLNPWLGPPFLTLIVGKSWNRITLCSHNPSGRQNSWTSSRNIRNQVMGSLTELIGKSLGCCLWLML